MSINSIQRAVWLALALPVAAPAALAAEPDETELDKVEVTGSRIKRIQVEGANPVVTVGREDIDRAGVSSIGEFLQQITASGSALNTKFNSSGNFGFPPDGGGVGAGSSQVDLRHLDAKRALVLVDGKRWVNESSASGVSGAVDLNTIPLSIVERIEVLLDGASTVYGTDAIAGVVNVITRKDFTGMDARATMGAYTDTGDGETETYELSMGKSDANSSVFFSLSYNDVGTIYAADRNISQEPVPGTGVTRGSSATPQGRFVFDNSAGANPTGSGLCAGNICNITTPQGAVFPANIPTFPNSFIPFTGAERKLWGKDKAAAAPRVLVNRRYYQELRSGKQDKGSRAWLSECLASANWLVKALDQRARTIVRVVGEIVKRQQGFFEQGVAAMKPMTLREVAQAIEMHESTVSRVTSNKYLLCDRGLFELKYFFGSGVASSEGEGEGAAAEAVKAAIRDIVDKETQVLSDDAIAGLLKQRGFDCARRTVVKYREAMGIGSSIQRRRQRKMAGAA